MTSQVKFRVHLWSKERDESYATERNTELEAREFFNKEDNLGWWSDGEVVRVETTTLDEFHADDIQKLKEKMKSIPMGSLQRELFDEHVESFEARKATRILKLLEEAEEASKKAIESVEQYRRNKK